MKGEKQVMKAFDLLTATLNGEMTPGESWQDEFNVWQWLDQGVLHVAPLSPADSRNCDRAIVLSCAIHGNETAPIELLVDMIQQLSCSPRRLQARVLFILGNPPAVVNQTRFIEENLNRLFSASQQQAKAKNPEQQRAIDLMAAVDQFFSQALPHQRRVHYDLHTAIRDSQYPFFAVYPYHPDGFKRAAVARMQAADVNTVLLSHEPATTFSYYSHAHHQAEAFTVELGKVKPFGENDMSKLQPLKQLLNQMLYGQWPEPTIAPEQLKLFTVTRAVHRQQQDFELSFDDKLANFSQFKQGQLLGRDGDTDIVAEHDGEAIVFPNRKVAVGQRALLTVIQATPDLLIN
ncbi:succinylglutamate desuccinylase [Neiella marina]|uniref:Succinylglutamate desuccinylase n=1 Tax=Neiella holothuriorum TaxID=2870530 RepID=A0ABS7EEK6_9GAMM|nr:succinylglutamate desuccinylase [Neiella holothuriorum]MBW8190670.1 succinylglutamate desuccinylase [Neiella holothuriorum]